MGEFNSDGHYIYYCGWESLRRNGVGLIVNERIQNSVLGCNLKNDKQDQQDQQDLLELTPKKDVLFVSQANHSVSQ